MSATLAVNFTIRRPGWGRRFGRQVIVDSMRGITNAEGPNKKRINRIFENASPPVPWACDFYHPLIGRDGESGERSKAVRGSGIKPKGRR